MTGLLNGLVDAVECSIKQETNDKCAQAGIKRKVSYQTALEDMPTSQPPIKRSRSSSDSDGEKDGKEQNGGGPSFLRFLEQLEKDGVVTRHLGDVPPILRGISGWTVNDGMMEEWQKRRRDWFMEGKEGKEYKPNSLYQILRRLGFFPTERTKRASHGFDFEGSRSFQWDGSQRYVQNRGKAGKSKEHGSTSPAASEGSCKSPSSEASSPSNDPHAVMESLPSSVTSSQPTCEMRNRVPSFPSRSELAIDLNKLLACNSTKNLLNFQTCSPLAQLSLPLSASLNQQLNSNLIQQQIHLLTNSNQLLQQSSLLSFLSSRPLSLPIRPMGLAQGTSVGTW